MASQILANDGSNAEQSKEVNWSIIIPVRGERVNMIRCNKQLASGIETIG